MTGSTEDSVEQLQQAMDVYLAWQADPHPCPPGDLLKGHPTLRDLLEPLIGYEGEDGGGANAGDEPATSRTESETDVSQAPDPTDRVLGDFRILREIGRGGMGVVFEAHQRSLGRRVALKVLSGQLTLSPGSIARFRREATTAAKLVHPNIVAVHAFGHADDTHFLAMEFVVAAPLDAVLRAVRETPMPELNGRDLWQAVVDNLSTDAESPTDAPTSAWQGGYLPTMLGLIAQIADALAFANQHGVIHRDVKPANILVRPDGMALLADFGLAKEAARPSLTVTGEFAGTPAYVSPEHAKARTDLDGRSDVYSLGATLYEILTKRPPFDGETSHQILSDILTTDPVDPQRLHPGLSPDLAAIVLKSLEKDPDQRYATAGEMAADLRAFLEYRPVQARLASRWTRTRRWLRREPLKAAFIGLAAASALALGGFGVYLAKDRATRTADAERTVRSTLARAEVAQGLGHWSELLAEVRNARTVAQTGGIDEDPALVRKLDQLEARGEREVAQRELDQRNDALFARLEEVRQPEGDPQEEHYPVLWDDVAAAHRKVMADDAVDALAGTEETAAAKLSGRGRPERFATVLDTWARACLQSGRREHGQRLVRLARRLDSDSERNELRSAILAEQPNQLLAFAQKKQLESLAPATLDLLGGALLRTGHAKQALAVYERGQARHPEDFVLTAGLARTLIAQQPPQPQQATRYYTAALAMRPESVEIRHELGRLLDQSLDEKATARRLFAESVARRPDDPHLRWHLARAEQAVGDLTAAHQTLLAAKRLDPTSGATFQMLGTVLSSLGRPADALAALDQSIALEPDSGLAHHHRGRTLLETNRFEEALAALDKALTLPLHPPRVVTQTHVSRGIALASIGRAAEGRQAFETAVAMDPEFALAHQNLGIMQRGAGELAVAEKTFRRSIELDPTDAQTYFHLGITLQSDGRPNDALVEFRNALGKGEDSEAWVHIGDAELQAQRHDAAVDAYRQALRMRPDFAEGWCNLSNALSSAGRHDEAVVALTRGHNLGRKRQDWGYPTDAWLADTRATAVLALAGEDETARLGAFDLQVENAKSIDDHAAVVELAARLFDDRLAIKPARLRQAGTSALRWADAALHTETAVAQRRRALQWLESWAIAVGQEAARELAKDRMLDPLRSPATQAQMDDADRAAWQRLFERIDADK